MKGQGHNTDQSWRSCLCKKKKALIDLQYKKKVWKGTFFASESASKKHTKMTYTCRYCFEKKLNQWLSTKIIKEFTDGISIIFL